MPSRIFLGLCLLECLENAVPNRDRVPQCFHAGRGSFEFVVPEVTVSRPGSENQIIVWDAHVRAVRRAGDDVALLFVHGGHLAKKHRGISLLPENLANGSGDLARSEDGSRHLIKQRLKEVMIGAVNQDDLDGWPTEGFGSGQSAKTSAHNNNTRQMFVHIFSVFFNFVMVW